VLDIEQFYPVFRAMEKHGLVLNLHGEMVSSPPSTFTKSDGIPAVTVLNAEPMFLPQLHKLHTAFPNLRIILEHVSTRQGLEAVQQCGPTVSRSTQSFLRCHLLLHVHDGMKSKTDARIYDIGGGDHNSTSPLDDDRRFCWGRV
jgi:dihydroorotase